MVGKCVLGFVGRRKMLLFVSLFVAVLLVSCTLVVGAKEVSLEGAVHVSDETELRNAVRSASNGTSVVIALANDIILTENALGIPANKDITLTSIDKEKGFYQLIGAVENRRVCTISVLRGGVLRLDGIIVTHAEGVDGEGIYVSSKGTLIMYDGKISGNNIPIYLSSGMWSGSGGGVENRGGVFVMFGGEISGNTAGMSGGGVYNVGNFTMHGGKISDNKAEKYGGGGVDNVGGAFVMFGGEITNNTAGSDGGGIRCGKFVMHDGKISNNYAKKEGGGVHVGALVMFGGEITNNTAGTDGGGAHVYNFTMYGGEISGNRASQAGGGIYVDIFDRFGGTISGNKASHSNNIYSPDIAEFFNVIISVSVVAIIVGAIGLFWYFKKKKSALSTIILKQV